MDSKHYQFLSGVLTHGFNNFKHKDQLTKWSDSPDDLNEVNIDIQTNLIAWAPLKENNTILYLTEKYFYEIVKNSFYVRIYRKKRSDINNRFAHCLGINIHEGKFKLGKEFLKDKLELKICL